VNRVKYLKNGYRHETCCSYIMTILFCNTRFLKFSVVQIRHYPMVTSGEFRTTDNRQVNKFIIVYFSCFLSTILREYMNNNVFALSVSPMCEGLTISICFLSPQVNGTEIAYEFEEITLERVSISHPSKLCLTSDNPSEQASALCCS